MKPLFESDLALILEKTRPHWEQIQGQRLLITGGTGFFGRWLVESFLCINRRLNLNASITILSRNPERFLQAMKHLADDPALTLVLGDAETFVFPDEECSYIIHADYHGIKRVLSFAQQCNAKRLLLTSSGAIYEPGDAYADEKIQAEALCTEAYRKTGLETVIARCFAFVGPHLPLDKHFAIGNFLGNALRQEPIHIQGDGRTIRSYMYAADLTIWLWVLLFAGQPDSPYDVGSPQAFTIQEVAHTVAHLIDPPLPVHIGAHSSVMLKRNRYIPNLERAMEELGLSIYTDLETALQRTLTWYQ